MAENNQHLKGTFLHRPCNETPLFICRRLLHGGGGVSIGVQSKPRRVVAQDAGCRFGVHAVLDGKGSIGVTQVVEPHILGDARVLTRGLVEPPHAVAAGYIIVQQRAAHIPDFGDGSGGLVRYKLLHLYREFK